MEKENTNQAPSRENLINIARDVSELTDRLDTVRDRIAKSRVDIENVCDDLSCTTEHIEKVRMSLFGIRAFLSRETAFGNYQ